MGAGTGCGYTSRMLVRLIEERRFDPPQAVEVEHGGRWWSGTQTSHGLVASSRGSEGGPGGVFSVEGSCLEAAVEDADESVGQLSECGVMCGAAGAEAVVVG